MNKNLMAFSIIFLGLSIILGCWFISQSLSFKKDDVVEQNRYEFIIMNDNENRIFDKQTGEYWQSISNNDNWDKKTPLTSNQSN
ncbi:hypothetical protein ACFY5J_23645 [Peribacillus butanolivorans]|uniref:hypothetical protein n=1 Tax=Peribacillus butanolivorans TaxID=421767 RepID=UPI0035D648F5